MTPEATGPEIAGAGDEATLVDQATAASREETTRTPASSDPKPRTRRRAATKRKAKKPSPAASKPTAVTGVKLREQRANAAAELLCLPAIPATIAGSEFLAGHFTTVGPITARRLAELAEQSPEIARVLDKANQGNVFLGLVMVALGYAGPVLLHVTGRTDQALGATMAVQMMDSAPGTLAAMMSAVADANEGPVFPDDNPPAVPPQHGPATPNGSPL